MKKLGLLLLPLFLLTAVLCSCSQSTFENGVFISEVMAKNTSSITDENGKHSDWIELYNPTQSAVDLEGYMLSDDPTDADKYVFPSVEIKPGQCLVLFADKTESFDEEKKIIHVPLSIGKKGTSIGLYDKNARLVNSIATGNLPENQSIGIGENGKLEVFKTPTPGKPNVSSQKDGVLTQEDKNALLINEYSTSSTQAVMDEDGDFVSFVEIYNDGEKSVNLSGYALSDDEQKPNKWSFPNVEIKGGGYLTVYLSGKDKTYEPGGALHASFKLSGNEQRLFLNDENGKTIDSVKVYKLKSNLTYGRTAKDKTKFAFFSKATPGKENNLTAFESIDTARVSKNKELFVTELAAVNESVKTASGKTIDYIELYNSTKSEINLKNYKLSDSKKAGSFRQLPSKTVKPGQYVVLFCSDKTYADEKSGEVFVKMSLKRFGKTIYLAEKSGVVVDSFKYSRLKENTCGARALNLPDDTVYCTTLTPGKKNPEKFFGPALSNPVFSKSSTYVKKNSKITIECPKGEVYYTTDGSEPTTKSKKYDGPITIKKTVAIRAKAFKNGFLSSDSVSATYIVGKKHSLPVVFLTTDSDNLYSSEKGIWADGPGKSEEFPYLGANFWKDWERPVNFEYMTADGVSQLEFDAGIKVFGQFSRAQAQKSVVVKLRDKYGPTEVYYPFFENNEVNVFSSLVLRDSGQDFLKSHIRDAFCAAVVKGDGDVDIMDYSPVVTYVNGKYHGIYDLREKLDADYLKNHYGIDKNNVDIIKGNSIVQSGSMKNYNELLSYIKTHDMSDDKCYEYVCSQIDIDNLITYWLCESFFTNTDTGNIRFYRENKDGAKWRWMLFDLDWALYPTTYTQNYIDNYLNPKGHGVGKSFRTTIMVGLMKNKNFRARLLQIHHDKLKTTFSTKRMLKIYDEMIEQIRPEMKAHCERWNGISYESWERSVKELRSIIEKKKSIFVSDMKKSFNMTQKEIEKYLSDIGD